MKKIICLVLSILMIFSINISVFASGEEQPSSGVYNEIEKVDTDTPVVVIRGIQFTTGLQTDRGTENAKPVKPDFQVGELFSYLAKALGALVTKLSVRSAVEVIVEYVKTLFIDYACDGNGNSVLPNISAAYYPESAGHYPELSDKSADGEIGLTASLISRYGGDKVYYYDYDWRLDPWDNADGLNIIINTALSDNNCEKVNLICCSMGGSQLMSYLAKYGYSKVESIISNTSAMFGIDVVTDLFKGDVHFDADGLVRYLSNLAPSLSGLLAVASKTGVIGGLCDFVNDFADEYKELIYEDSLVPTLATLPGYWSMVKAEDYPECREFIFGDKQEEYKGLLERLDRLYEKVLLETDNIIKNAVNDGVRLTVIANYNTPCIPAYKNAIYQGDGLLETGPMSGGALVSVIGSTLSEEYLAVGESKYVSPDKCINASTCSYPDYTWFAKDGGHVVGIYGSEFVHLIFNMLESETQPTVNTWKQYPQFMLCTKGENLEPLV